MPTETRSLHRKLAQIMFEAERIPKRGHAPKEMGGYPFVQVGDAADYIRKALAEHVLTMMPTGVQVVGQADRPTKSGGSMTTVDLVTTWTITDGESGETIEIQSFGAGADGGDKYSGKASTSAMKYALLTAFLLSTGEDSEMGGPEAAGQRRPTGTVVPLGVEPATPAEAGPPVTQHGDEQLEILGRLSKAGTVRKGGSDKYKLEPRQTPDGYAIGFRLEIDGDRDIPQVLAEGEFGYALYMATAGDPEKALLGKHVRVKGRLYNVRVQGRKGYYRLVLTDIEAPEFTLPAPVNLGEQPPELDIPEGQEPLFDEGEQEAIDKALAVTK